MLSFDDYQTEAKSTAIYPSGLRVIYPVIGLAGECGEISEKIKKLYRDKEGVFTYDDTVEIEKEIGDVLWYLAALADDLGISLEGAAMENLDKLRSRQARGVLSGSGDNR